VSTWRQDAVRIRADDGGAFQVESSGAVVRVRPEQGRWRRRAEGGRERYQWNDYDDGPVHFRIQVPPYVALTLSGAESDITVSGTTANISIDTQEGAVVINGGGGRIVVNSVEDAVQISGARGRVDVSAGDGDVVLRDIVGEVSVQSIDGDVVMSGIESRSVEVSTVDGDIRYSGSIREGGRYVLSTHDGDVTLTVPPDASADVTVANFQGGFETTFPIVLRESQHQRLRFTLGAGGATVILEAFDGDVYLRRGRN
jgi:DUF4097 and DUF4098 domain-containing protein YvlB